MTLGAKVRVGYVWAVLVATIVLATSWLLSLLHFPMPESLAIVAGLGYFLRDAAPWLRRRLRRRLR